MELDKIEKTNIGVVKALYQPPPTSHKGQNGKLTIIGGSRLFHGASLWALKVASRIVDLVFYSSIPENLKLAQKLKSQIYDFIAVPREAIRDYIEESDAVLIGPGLMREEETKILTEKLIKKFSKKRWVIDAGSLQMMNKNLIPKDSILLPHQREFKRLFDLAPNQENAAKMARKYNCVVLLKGRLDYICSPSQCQVNTTGNEGMTKGGTGEVLAGLTAALACKNKPFLAANAAAFVNGLAGDRLKKRVGVYYNASDLADEIPATLKWCLDYKS
jgi:NAD(P)H-hydrate epimerase